MWMQGAKQGPRRAQAELEMAARQTPRLGCLKGEAEDAGAGGGRPAEWGPGYLAGGWGMELCRPGNTGRGLK